MNVNQNERIFERDSYMQRYRSYGDGLIRISKKIEISKDIYALGFICQLRYDILSEYFDFENDKLLKNDKKYKV